MSDSEDYEYEYDSDAQFGDSEEESQDDASIELENAFYEADDCASRSPEKALGLFLKVYEMELSKKDNEKKWTLKALENVVKLCGRTKQEAKMVKYTSKVLENMEAGTRNECSESIHNILEAVNLFVTSSNVRSEIYEMTLKALKKSNYDRLWFHTNTKLAKLYLEVRDFVSFERVLKDLRDLCESERGPDSGASATMLLEVYCLEIQYCRAVNNLARLRQIYPKTLDLDSAISDPRMMGMIREEGGKMYMAEGKWTLAYNEFFEAFRNYQETGNRKAKDCLKYVCLASMLASSDINPFDSREAKVYKDVDEINAMIVLRSAYESKDILAFENTMRNPKHRLVQDEFMNRFINPLLRNLRLHVLVRTVAPYRNVRLEFLADKLNIVMNELESLATELIGNDILDARVDEANGVLVLGISGQKRVAGKVPVALKNWKMEIQSLNVSIQDRFTTLIANSD